MSKKKDKKNNKKHLYNDQLMGSSTVIDFHTKSASPNHSHYPSPRIKKIQARTQAQGQFMAAIRSHTLIFGLGPAGTGKSYCTAAMASESLMNDEIDKIIFTRPAVETGNSMGFLPGKLDEKFDPYFSAFKTCLTSSLGKGVVDCAIKNGNIHVEPLAYMRGKTFNRSFVVLDEAQNCTADEIKMFMTRIGRDSTVVICGDLSQPDIEGCSGLYDAISRVKDVDGIYVHQFEHDDIVRSGIVKDILMCYEDRTPSSFIRY